MSLTLDPYSLLIKFIEIFSLHRCQGDRFTEAGVVDFPPSTNEHRHYVGLSGVSNGCSLHTINFNVNEIKVSETQMRHIDVVRCDYNIKKADVNILAFLVPSVTIFSQNVNNKTASLVI